MRSWRWTRRVPRGPRRRRLWIRQQLQEPRGHIDGSAWHPGHVHLASRKGSNGSSRLATVIAYWCICIKEFMQNSYAIIFIKTIFNYYFRFVDGIVRRGWNGLDGNYYFISHNSLSWKVNNFEAIYICMYVYSLSIKLY